MDTTSQATTAAHSANTTQRMRLLLSGVCSWATMASVYRCLQAWSRRRGERSRSPQLDLWARAGLAAAVVAAGLLPGSAYGQATDPPSYRLDTTRGPVASSSRIVGVGGAFTGIAEGVDAASLNSAALANRPERSTSWFDYDFSLGFSLTPGSQVDLDGDGRAVGDSSDLNLVDFGLSLQFDTLAIGILVKLISYQADEIDLVAQQDVKLGVAYAFGDGELLVGTGINVRSINVGAGDGGQEWDGPSIDVSLLWRPELLPFRVGAQVRFGTAMVREDANPAFVLAQGEVRAVNAPVELAVGASYFIAADPERRYNTSLRQGHGKVSDALDSDLRYVLLTSDVVVTGATRNAHNVEGFVAGAPRRAGGTVTAAWHVGVESELVSNLLRARLGGYLEARRVHDGHATRPHGTGGMELRLFRLWEWQLKVSIAADIAAGYQNILFGIGFWN